MTVRLSDKVLACIADGVWLLVSSQTPSAAQANKVQNNGKSE